MVSVNAPLVHPCGPVAARRVLADRPPSSSTESQRYDLLASLCRHGLFWMAHRTEADPVRAVSEKETHAVLGSAFGLVTASVTVSVTGSLVLDEPY